MCELLDRFQDKVKDVVAQTIASYTETKPSKVTYFESLRKTKVHKFVSRLEALDKFPEIWG